METPTKMDENWGYPHFRKPPYGLVQNPQSSQYNSLFHHQSSISHISHISRISHIWFYIVVYIYIGLLTNISPFLIIYLINNIYIYIFYPFLMAKSQHGSHEKSPQTHLSIRHAGSATEWSGAVDLLVLWVGTVAWDWSGCWAFWKIMKNHFFYIHMYTMYTIIYIYIHMCVL